MRYLQDLHTYYPKFQLRSVKKKDIVLQKPKTYESTNPYIQRAIISGYTRKHVHKMSASTQNTIV